MSLFRINTNVSALFANRQLRSSNRKLTDARQNLSTGKRINSASDDAAGLAISEKMTSQIQGYQRASRNAQDGISMIQTAEGALEETHSNLQRMRELAVQAANGTNTDEDREKIQDEIDQLAAEIQRTADQTQFNKKNLLNGDLDTSSLQVGPNSGQNINFSIDDMGTEEDALELSKTAKVPFAGPIKSVSTPGHDGLEGRFQVRETTNEDGETMYELVTIEAKQDPAAGGKNGKAGRVVATSQAYEDPTVLSGLSGSDSQDEPVDAGILWEAVPGTVFQDDDGDLLNFLVNQKVSEGSLVIGEDGSGNDNKVLSLSKTQTVRTKTDPDLPSGKYTVDVFDRDNNGNITIELYSPSGETVGRTREHSPTTDAEESEIFYKPGTIGTPDEEIVLDLSDKIATSFGADLGGFSQNDTPFAPDQSLFIGGPDVFSGTEAASSTIGRIDNAIAKVSEQRSNLGALQNRLESTIRSDDITGENLQSSRSRIRDADIAEEAVQQTRANILIEVGTSVLAQANQTPELALELVQ